MNYFADAFAFIFTGQNWLGDEGIAARLGTHLAYTGISVLIGLLIAVPLGLAIGHTGRGRAFVITVTGGARALPTFGLLLFFVLIGGLQLWPLIVVLVILAVPPILAGVYSGMEAIDRQTIDAARAVGLSEWQILWHVEVPLALPLIVGGLRSGVLQVIATATVAGYVSLGALGRYLIEGLTLHKYTLVIVGAILVAALALIVDALFAIIQRLVVPRGVSRGATRPTKKSRSAIGRPSGPSEALRTPITEGS